MFRATLFKTCLRYKNIIASAVAIVFVLALAYAGSLHPTAHAQQQGSIGGWPWSDTIGWIDIGSTGHGDGLTLQNGVFSGYAWSDNIGWVSFSQSSGCPSGTCTAQVGANGTVTGWARAISAIGRSDGWDGWIDLGSTGHGDGLTLQNGTLSGYAWGSDVVGWVQFTGTMSCTPSYSCNAGSSVYTNSQCQTTTTSCPGGCNSATGQCNTCTPSYSCSGTGVSVYTNSQCQTTDTQCTTGPCDAATGQCTAAPAGNASGCLSVGTDWPTCTKTGRVTTGDNATLYWYTTATVTSCTLTGSNGDHWTVPNTAHGSETTSAISSDTTYNISCTGSAPFTDSVVINLVPKVIEK